jgi:hypothetical protein
VDWKQQGGLMIIRTKIAVLLPLTLVTMMSYGMQNDVRTKTNPKNPPSQNAGRIVSIKEVTRIDDKHEGYFFQYPHNLQIADDGSLFFIDKNQFLKFDKDGNFKGNFYKHGQGPGELHFIENYIFKDGRIIIFDRPLSKIMFLTQEGELEGELKLRIPGLDSFLTRFSDTYYFFKTNPPNTKGVPEIVELDENLIAVMEDGESMSHIMAFPRPYMIMKAGNNSFTGPWAGLHKCFMNIDTVFISHRPEYLIKLFSLKDNRVLFQFNREYERVKPTKDSKKYAPGGNFGKISIGGAWFEAPKAKYHVDIQKMFLMRDKLWIITSTVDENKGILVDVFDLDGNYIDNFFLDYPEGVVPYSVNSWIKAASGDFIYTVEKGGAEEITIVKNRVVNFD